VQIVFNVHIQVKLKILTVNPYMNKSELTYGLINPDRIAYVYTVGMQSKCKLYLSMNEMFLVRRKRAV